MKRRMEHVSEFIIISMIASLVIVSQVGASETPKMSWLKTFGGIGQDTASSIVNENGEGYVLVGFTSSFGVSGYDIWLSKIDSSGNLQWNRTYGGVNDDYGYSVILTSDGYVLSGSTSSFGAGGSDGWLIKTDSFGNILWNQTYGGANLDLVYSVVQTSDGGYALVGVTYSFGEGVGDVWFVKTDSFGRLQWNQTYGGSNEDYAYSIIQLNDGYVLSGSTSSFGAGGSDGWLIKTDSFGNVLWNQTFGGTKDDYFHLIIQLNDGYVLSGSTSSFGAGGSDGWLIKTDSFGNILWNQTYGGPNEDYISSAIKAVDEGYTLVGYTLSFGAGGSDAWLINTDSTGNLKWNQTFGGQKYEYGGSLIKTNDNSFIIAGSVLDSPSDFESSDLLVIKIEGKNIIEIEIFWLIIGIIFVILIIFGYVKFRNMKK